MSVSTILPINLDNLLRGVGVESARVEFKASWNRATAPQVLTTICAFANDYHNLNGGYVVVGVSEQDGRAVLPPSGLSASDVAKAQKWIRGNCNRLDPAYQPVLSPETVEGRLILVVWAPASNVRPHRAPDPRGGKDRRYWIRLGSETVDAEQRGDLRGLIEQTAKVPWDDRRSHEARIDDLRDKKVREYLRDVQSGLLDEPDMRNVFRRMQITVKVNDHEVPRNVGVLFFASDPAQWSRGAQIDVVQFVADRGGDVLEERTFRGGLADQLRDCLSYLENLSTYHLQKQHDRVRARGWVGYPMPALRETLVNAVYHRGYDVDQPEPTKVYLYPDRIVITSYPGPVPGIEAEHLLPNAPTPSAPARNRRIGEFLKELRLAEARQTGLHKVFQAMDANGSPTPRFVFDEQRTFFQATLPAHPEYAALSALRDAAHLRVLGDHASALRRIESAWRANQASAVLASEAIRAYVGNGQIEQALQVLEAFKAVGPEVSVSPLTNTLINCLLEAGEESTARRLLRQSRPMPAGQEAIEVAVLARRAGDYEAAHWYFECAGEAVYGSQRALLEFAQTKLWYTDQPSQQPESHRRLLVEARSLLERAIQLDASPVQHAWAWRELARTLDGLRVPIREVEEAYRRAIDLLPDEPSFVQELERLGSARR